MIARLMWTALAVGLLMALGAAPAAAGAAKYVGAAKCKTCHKKELIGNQYGVWEGSPHAKAVESLKSDAAKKVAAENGISGAPHEAAECLKCHATASAVDPSMVEGKPLKVEDGVQCESCHGPGSEYRKKKVMADHAASVAAGLWEPGKDAAICTACHNDQSPTYKGFDYEARKKDIAHPIPAEVKGRYIEAEKEARAKKE
jgi:hypothetical protein